MSFRNVNNWHWVERDCTKWAKDYLGRILVTEFDGIKMSEISEIEGDAVVSQRKGKVMAIYDLNIGARVSQGANNFEAKIELCSESCGEDPAVTLSPSNAELSRRISKFMILISKKFSDDMVESHKSALGNSTDVIDSTQRQEKLSSVSKDSAIIHNDNSMTTKIVNICLPIDPNQIRNILMNPELVTRWSAGSYRKSDSVSSLYDGLIIYSFLNISEHRIEMNWKLKDWSSYGNLNIKIEPNGCDSNIILGLTNIPSAFASDAEPFFERYYWQPIKRMLGIF